jgi:hypothetical protein
MSRFNISENHPLIPNANDYTHEKQFISIHSEDRNVVKYPNASEFEIELPQDYCNVVGVRLDNWCFPSNYNVFSPTQNNVSLVFQITQPFNPADYNITDPLMLIISEALFSNFQKQYVATIQEGFYNPFQMVTELTNKMNDIVSRFIATYIATNNPSLMSQFDAIGGYTQFVVVYNTVSQKIWFGNKSSQFVISNSSSLYVFSEYNNLNQFNNCIKSQQYPDFSNWGLPSHLGFNRCDATSITSSFGAYPRFYYGDVNTPGDNGYWLVPDPAYLGTNATIPVYFLEAPYKINIMGPSHFYIEVEGMNTIDETIPFAVNEFTTTTNITNGVVKSAFAKIPVTTTPISQWYDNYQLPTKIYNPPAERIRKMKIKVRYHNGCLVQFGNTDYTLLFEFTILRPMNNREYKRYNPEPYLNHG